MSIGQASHTFDRQANLKDQLQFSERIFQETGRYWGIERLTLKETDPFRYERVYAELRGGLVTARETALHISASPIVRNIGELCFAFYTPEGDSVAISTGIIVHVHTMSNAIKFMINKGYEANPGINEGDIFCNNDPDLGNVHTTDVHTLIPIFWEGDLIGWAGGVTHEVDIGASTPGHDPVASSSRFEDGFYVTAEKIGEHDEVSQDFKIRGSRGTRTPMYWDLDEKCRVAGVYMIRDAVHRLIRQEGLDYFKDFMRESVEEGRRIFLARVRERLVPGVYRTASFSDAPFKEKAWHPEQRQDRMMHAPMTITIGSDGSFFMNMEGASAPVPMPFNASEGSMQGALWVQLTQTLIYDGKVNDGSYLAARCHFPKGSWCNPGDSLLAYGSPWDFLIPAFTGMFRLLSRAYFARGYREEIVSGYGFTGDATQGGGFLANGQYFPVSNFELCSVGLGARGVMDGLDAAYAMWNPEADMGDVEVWEIFETGLLYLSRRMKPDTAGYGRYRGGSGWESLRMVHGVREAQLYAMRGDGLTFHGSGLFGGYPGATGYRLFAKKTNIQRLIQEQLPYPLGDQDPNVRELQQKLESEFHHQRDAMIFPTQFNDGDLWLAIFSGGPGYGDPLERKSDSLAVDVRDHIFSPRTAENVFGVVVEQPEPGSAVVDTEKTEKARSTLRQSRVEKSVDYDTFWSAERQRLLDRRLIDPVSTMYRESFTVSPKWETEFKDFWQLPEDFAI